MLPFLPLAVGKIVRHPSLDVAPFAIEIALRFENCPSNQRVEPAAHLRHSPLEVQRPQLRAEFLD